MPRGGWAPSTRLGWLARDRGGAGRGGGGRAAATARRDRAGPGRGAGALRRGRHRPRPPLRPRAARARRRRRDRRGRAADLAGTRATATAGPTADRPAARWRSSAGAAPGCRSALVLAPLPFGALMRRRALRAGLATQSWSGWAGDVARSGALGAAFAGRRRGVRRRADAPLRRGLVEGGGGRERRGRGGGHRRRAGPAGPDLQRLHAAARRRAAARGAGPRRARGRARRRGLRGRREPAHQRRQRLRQRARREPPRGPLRHAAGELHPGRGAVGRRPRARARALPRRSAAAGLSGAGRAGGDARDRAAGRAAGGLVRARACPRSRSPAAWSRGRSGSSRGSCRERSSAAPTRSRSS